MYSSCIIIDLMNIIIQIMLGIISTCIIVHGLCWISDRIVNRKERKKKYRNLLFRRNIQKFGIITKKLIERDFYFKEIEDYTGSKIERNMEKEELIKVNKKINPYQT